MASSPAVFSVLGEVEGDDVLGAAWAAGAAGAGAAGVAVEVGAEAGAGAGAILFPMATLFAPPKF